MKKLLPSIVTGFAAGVLTTVPLLKNFACCLLLPAAAVFAVFLDQKANGEDENLLMSKGVVIGLMTGIFAAVFGSTFDILITYIAKSNDLVSTFSEMQNFISNFPINETMKQQITNMMQSMVDDISRTGFSLFYTVSVIVNNFISNSIFGVIGGLVGVQIYKSRKARLQ